MPNTSSTQKHTPGPWQAGAPIFDDTEDMARIEVRVPGTTPVIAEVLLLNSDENEMKANARLIAAAPELREAVRVLLTYFDVEGSGVARDAKALLARIDGQG